MLKPITTEEEYDDALARAYKLMQMDVKENITEFNQLEALGIRIEEYEKKHYPITTSRK